MKRGKLRTKRWNDPVEAADGTRILICRYRPRALPKKAETWTEWIQELAPSKELHAAIYGKDGPPIGFDVFAQRFRAEMARQRPAVEALAQRVRRGETVTVLCSSACVDPARCHRTIVAALVDSTLNK